MLKTFHFPRIHGNQSGWGNRVVEKALFLDVFELLQPFPRPTLRHIQLLVGFKWYSAFIKRKIMRSVLPPSGRNHGNNQSTVAKKEIKSIAS